MINWHYGMEPFRGCAKPGTYVHLRTYKKKLFTGSMVTFNFISGHNVNKLTKSEYGSCTTHNHTGVSGPVEEPAHPENEHFYFACGVSNHCENGGMRADIIGSLHCTTGKTLSGPQSCVYS